VVRPVYPDFRDRKESPDFLDAMDFLESMDQRENQEEMAARDVLALREIRDIRASMEDHEGFLGCRELKETKDCLVYQVFRETKVCLVFPELREKEEDQGGKDKLERKGQRGILEILDFRDSMDRRVIVD
jgi:hypothetical protein